MLTIDVYDQQFRQFFIQYRAKLTDPSRPLDIIGQGLVNRVSGRFETQTDPNGQAWAPWAAYTRKNYPADGNYRILDRYGDMLGSLNHQVDTSDSSVTVGFGTPYAVYHEWGTKHMPRRGMLMNAPDEGTLAPADVEYVLDVLQHEFSM